jgi:hypothetical protein
VNIPSRVLEAAGDAGGGQMVIVMGAGCSIEQPSCLPDSRHCSRALWQKLLDDDVLTLEDCANPDDLSCLADAVYAKLGSQEQLVRRLPADFHSAQPNEGSMLAAALLREGVASHIVTLNFDLTMTQAVRGLGTDPAIAIIARPEEHDKMRSHNLVYLHRNVEAEDPDTLVLRTAALAEQWKEGWEQVMAQIALAAPVVVFAGLGTEVGVLVSSALRVKAALSETVTMAQVDIGSREESVYAAKLDIDAAHFISAPWSTFMRHIGQRVAQGHIRTLQQASALLVDEHGVAAEAADPLLERLVERGLLYLGGLRARWTLDPSAPYRSAAEVSSPLLADLLLAVTMLERLSGCEAHFVDDGLIELRRDGLAAGVVVVATGLGVGSRVTTEDRLRRDQARHVATALRPAFGVLAHVKNQRQPVAAPADIVAEADVESIVTGPGPFPIFDLEELRAEPADALALVRAA